MQRRAVAVTALALLLGVAGCRGCLPCPTQSGHAVSAKRRKQRIESSLTLVPYRVLKTVLRGSKVTPPPPEFVALLVQIEALEVQSRRSSGRPRRSSW